jgi:hypothetical protein
LPKPALAVTFLVTRLFFEHVSFTAEPLSHRARFHRRPWSPAKLL